MRAARPIRTPSAMTLASPSGSAQRQAAAAILPRRPPRWRPAGACSSVVARRQLDPPALGSPCAVTTKFRSSVSRSPVSRAPKLASMPRSSGARSSEKRRGLLPSRSTADVLAVQLGRLRDRATRRVGRARRRRDARARPRRRSARRAAPNSGPRRTSSFPVPVGRACRAARPCRAQPRAPSRASISATLARRSSFQKS